MRALRLALAKIAQERLCRDRDVALANAAEEVEAAYEAKNGRTLWCKLRALLLRGKRARSAASRSPCVTLINIR